MTAIDSKAFLDGGKTAVHALRRALAAVLVAAGADPERPQDVSRRFGLDKTLTWRIARVVREEDAWEAIPHIPRRPSIRILVDKMLRHGVAREKLDALVSSVDDFERFIEVHTGDRETLEMMIGTASKRSAEKRMETFRKNGFQANSAVWGIRAKLQFGASFVLPTPDETQLSTAMVCGFVGLRRLRANVPWAIAAATAWDEDGKASTKQSRGPLPLHADGLIGGAPLLPAFCSEPLPELRAVRVAGASRFELAPGPVGNTGATTVTLGWTWAETVSAYETVPGEGGEHGMRLSTPVEMALYDVYVHRSQTYALNVTASVYSDLPGGPRYPDEGKDSGLLPVQRDVADLGAGPPDTTTPEFPRYGALIETTLNQLGYPIEEFHGFRYRLRYPPIPTFMLLRHPLLPR